MIRCKHTVHVSGCAGCHAAAAEGRDGSLQQTSCGHFQIVPGCPGCTGDGVMKLRVVFHERVAALPAGDGGEKGVSGRVVRLLTIRFPDAPLVLRDDDIVELRVNGREVVVRKACYILDEERRLPDVLEANAGAMREDADAERK